MALWPSTDCTERYLLKESGSNTSHAPYIAGGGNLTDALAQQRLDVEVAVFHFLFAIRFRVVLSSDDSIVTSSSYAQMLELDIAQVCG